MVARSGTSAAAGGPSLVKKAGQTLAARAGSMPLLLTGSVLAALYMGGAVLGWGAAYCARGVESAVPYVAGGFACALVPDLTFMGMSGVLGAVGCATLPLLSCVLLATQDLIAPLTGERPAGTDGQPGGAPAARRPRGIAGCVRVGLGIGPAAACSIALVMFGLGYMQHNITFSPSMSLDGPMVDVARAVASLAILLFWLAASRWSRNVYRVGLLMAVAGLSLMPFLYQMPWFWVCGAVNIAGYATFDVLVWVIVAQAARAGLARALPLVCAIRLLVSSLFSAAGGFCAVAITHLGGAVPFAFGEAVFVGYLMTVAIVLVVGDHDV